jgi:hypothetical protein
MVAKCCLKLAVAAGSKDNYFFSERTGSRLRVLHFEITVRMVRVHEKTDDSSLRHKLMQQLQSLGDRRRTEYGDASGIASRSAEARYQAFPDGVAVAGEHDRNRLSSRFGYLRRGLAPSCGNYIDLSAHEFGCQLR